MLATNFLVPNATFFVELAAFLLVLGILARYVLPIINKAVDERQAIIRQGLADAEEAKHRSDQAQEDYKRAISEARSEARAVVDEANKLAEQFRTEKRAQADQEYEQRLARAQEDIDARTRQASEELRRHTADLAIAVAERVVGEGLDSEAHRGLIDRTIAEVEASGGPR